MRYVVIGIIVYAAYFLICFLGTGTDQKNMKMFYAYPPAVQTKIRNNSKLNGMIPKKHTLRSAFLYLLLFTVLFCLIAWIFGMHDFWKTFICFLIMGEGLNLFDLVVVDALWWRHTKRIRFLGIEDAGDYQSMKTHLASFWRGIPIFALAAAITAAMIPGLAWKYAYVDRKNMPEAHTFAKETNTDSIYSDSQFKKILKESGFGEEYNLDKVVSDSYVMPGLKATRTLDQNGSIAMCTSMVPQGVCVTEDYVLMSAYCGKKQHNSVIYVIDKTTHDFVKELVLKGTPHVGGITYDPKNNNIWICDFRDSEQEAAVGVIALEELKRFDLGTDKAPCQYEGTYPVYSIDRASFMDYNAGNLYIGNFVKDRDDISTIQCFPLKEDGTPYILTDYSEKDLQDAVNEVLSIDDEAMQAAEDLLKYEKIPESQKQIRKSEEEIQTAIDEMDDDTMVPNDVSLIGGKIQGCAIGDQYAAMSESGGPSNSRIYIFKNSGKLDDVFKTSEDAITSYTLPPMLEELADDDDKLYLCFESSAYIYRARWNPKIDRIVVLDED